MLRKTSLICAVWMAGFLPAHAGQPISESMIQCGALYTVASDRVSTFDRARRLHAAAQVWADAALAQAENERRSDTEGYVSHLWGEKCAQWSDKGALYFFSEDFRDWTSYCRALARSRGLHIDPD
ncbi:hypothetical protein [uncultured Roseobacter sp.]|uniref:hypothetical protein n=1 Tax=uncultured Roseobacter sp. TaxID=114847 RepID=UPI0026027345|nr:hypothetical protein [uncultured Roseobacter sp.]